METQHLVALKKEETSFFKSLNMPLFYVILKFDSQSQYMTFYAPEGILHEREIF